MDVKYKSIWTIQHIRDGKVIWEDVGPNSLSNQGQEEILETYFRNNTPFIPTQFYVRLCNETLVLTSTLTSVSTEPAGTYGYAPILIPRTVGGFPTKTLVGPSWTITSIQVSWTATGGTIGPVTTAYLGTTNDNTGVLIAFRALSQTRTILAGDTMTLQFAISLS